MSYQANKTGTELTPEEQIAISDLGNFGTPGQVPIVDISGVGLVYVDFPSGSTPDLQAVTDIGASTTNPITVIPEIVTYTIGNVTSASATQESGYGFYAYGYTNIFRVYAGRTIGSDTFWSATGYTFQMTDDGSYNPYSIDLSWGAVANADIYRVVIEEDQFHGYYDDRYFETTSTSLNYDATGILEGGTPTPSSPLDLPGPAFIVDGGTSSQFLKADGSYDDTSYLTSETQDLDDVLALGNTTTREFTTGKHIISGSGTFFYGLDIINTGGRQTDMRWIAPATTDTGYNYMFGADVSGANDDNFFIWNLRINRPALYYSGDATCIAFNSNGSLDSTGAKVQIKNDYSATNALSINNGKLLIKMTGDIFFADGVNMDMGTTTGTKIGLGTTEKIGFWNATPIVQPTTSVSGASFTANSGTAVNDASTFDGYTIGKVVKALRNAGLLA
jgi:hypothetical protein